MRFDDMLATVLARSAERPADRVAQWRQLLDLLAQRRPGADPGLARRALARLQDLRADVPVEVRRETARAFAGRPVPAPLVVFLAGDVPRVAGALLSQVRLNSEDWLAVLPRLSPTGRGFLRHRRDLGAEVEAALAGFGTADLAIAGDVSDAVEAPASRPAEPAPAADTDGSALEPGAGEGQIRAIISRIARFKEGRGGIAPAAVAEEPSTVFRFEAGPDGVIGWVDGAPRGALIGARIDGDLGRRAAFRDRRLRIAGRSPVAGDWMLAAVPVFAAASGQFVGFRGVARRARAEEIEGEGQGRLGLRPDSLRQLVHELRTPLNAIGGFAEMIRHQMRGPISTAYRQRAELIVEQAGRLLAAVDDLDVAARLETQRLDLQHVEVDLAAVLDTVCRHYAESARRAGFDLEHGAATGLPATVGDPAAVRRMVGRLIAAAVGLAGQGESIRADLSEAGNGQLELAVSRPRLLAGLDADALFDPALGPEEGGPDAPLLGLGFSLFLVRRLARAMGGVLRIDADRFLLRLPTASPALHAEAV